MHLYSEWYCFSFKIDFISCYFSSDGQFLLWCYAILIIGLSNPRVVSLHPKIYHSLYHL